MVMLVMVVVMLMLMASCCFCYCFSGSGVVVVVVVVHGWCGVMMALVHAAAVAISAAIAHKVAVVVHDA